MMARIEFFEKPGCAGNARQKALLEASGHEIESQDLLATPWTPSTLRPFFGARPVADWFNRAAPQVKSGVIEPEAMTCESALAAMIASPILIRRPLMKVGERREAGFDQDVVAAWIGLQVGRNRVTDVCARAPAIENPPAREAADPLLNQSRSR
jgi:nitrogenase-associated protein